MELVVSGSARDFLGAHGGVAFVRTHSYRCCSAGSMTLLDIDTSTPSDADRFSAIEVNDVDVRYLVRPLGTPRQSIIDTRGRVRRRLVAYWDGCAFKT